MMRQWNGCSTPAPRSNVAKQWFEELAQKMKCLVKGGGKISFQKLRSVGRHITTALKISFSVSSDVLLPLLSRTISSFSNLAQYLISIFLFQLCNLVLKAFGTSTNSMTLIFLLCICRLSLLSCSNMSHK